MIQGHGDDAYRYARPIRANFSSNVYGHVDLEPLKAHLRERLDAIGNYPEPEPYRLESALAGLLGLDPAYILVTAGATEAIYLVAHAFQGSRSTILQPTFSEYADACRLYGESEQSCGCFSASDLFSGARRKTEQRNDGYLSRTTRRPLCALMPLVYCTSGVLFMTTFLSEYEAWMNVRVSPSQ